MAEQSISSKALPHMLNLDHVSPATRLLEKRRQMFEMQEALDAQKDEYARREDTFRRREEGLRKKDLELQESLIKFNKFLQENETKRNRAIKRAADEKKQREVKEQDIERLLERLNGNTNESEKLSKEYQRNVKYTQYLELVQETVPEDYPEISDLMNRYNTLKDANADLSKSQCRNEQDHEKERLDFANFSKEKGNEILNFNNEIASLQKQLETGESNVLKYQNEVDSGIRSTSDKTLELAQIVMAIRNLLQRSTSGIHGATLKHTEINILDGLGNVSGSDINSNIEITGSQGMMALDVIASYMVDFTSIVEARIESQKAGKRQTNFETQGSTLKEGKGEYTVDS